MDKSGGWKGEEQKWEDAEQGTGLKEGKMQACLKWLVTHQHVLVFDARTGQTNCYFPGPPPES